MKTCLILGNGPSLNRLPQATWLSGIESFGMNFAKMQPTFYCCIDSHILTEHAKDIYLLVKNAEIAYLSAKHAGSSFLYTDNENVQLVDKDTGAFHMERFMSGLSATYVCLKLAYYAGFQEVHLWGVDHSPDWQHYRDDYHADAVNPDNERMRVMEWHYQLAMMVYARAGRRIFNHSDPSRLDMIFRRGDTINSQET